MIEKVRRVVMGEPEPNRSEFTHVEEIESLPIAGAGLRWWPVWGWNELPTLPHHGAEPWTPESFFPRLGGLRVSALSNDLGPEPSEEDVAKSDRLLTAEPGGLYHDPDRPRMHKTDSVDIGIVVSGEFTTAAEDGTQLTLGPGDVFVQNGALHEGHWNPDNPGHIVLIKIGAERNDA
ncbi:MAG: hypothetical protein WBC33_00210 [Conexibacter sp.]